MFDELSWFQGAGLFLIVTAFGFYVQRIDARTRAIRNQVARQSLTFQKIENDLAAIQDSILLLARNDENVLDQIVSVRDRRPVTYRHIVENGPSSNELLRGLEPPDMDDDPNFWKGNLADRMDLPKSLAEARDHGDFD